MRRWLLWYELSESLWHDVRTPLVVRQAEALEQHLPDELSLGLLLVLGDGLLPVVPAPAELEVGQVVAEPADEPVEAGHVHDGDPLVEQLGGLGQDLGHGGGLQLAQLDQDRPVGQLQAEGVGQPEDLAEHDLDYDVLEGDLVLEGVGEQLGGHLLPLLEAGHEDVVELLLDEPPLDTVLARQDGALGGQCQEKSDSDRLDHEV